MKTLKKALCLVLAVVMVVGTFALSASAAESNFAPYTDAVAAKASKHVQAIDANIGLGIINGVSKTELSVDGTLTRAQAAKILAYLKLGEEVADSIPAGATGFSDVPATNWAAKFIAYGADQGFIAGNGDGTFNPGGKLTGYQFLKLVLNAMGIGISSQPVSVLNNGIIETQYKTVNKYEGTYWYLAVDTDAKANGLETGLEGINLNQPLTRAQAMQIVFNAVTAGSPAIFAGYNLTAATGSENTKDAYGRNVTAWAKASEPSKAITDAYAQKGTEFVANSDTTVKALLAAYDKANGTKYAEKAAETAVKAGTVLELKLNKDNTYSEYVSYTYKLTQVTNVATAKNGKVTVTTGLGQVKGEELGVAVVKGDYIAVPYADALVWADAVKVAATAVEITATDAQVASKFAKAGSDTYFFDGNYNALDSKNVVAGGKYDFYLSPVGTVLASKETKAAQAEKPETTLAFAVAEQAQAYKAATTGETDLIGNTSGAAEAKEGIHVVQILSFDGSVKNLKLAVKYDEKQKDYVYTGDYSAYTGKVATKAVANVGKYVEYYTLSDGSIVITDIHDVTSVTTKKGNPVVGTDRATASTTISIVYKQDPKTGKFDTAAINGYKDFKDATYENAYVISKDGVVSAIYAVNVEKGAAPVVEAPKTVGYVLNAGVYTTKGYEYTLLVEGKEVVVYGGTGDKEIKVEKGKYYEITDKDGVLQSATVKTDFVSGKITAVVDGYFVVDGKDTAPVLYDNLVVYTTTDKASAELAKDQIIDYFTSTNAQTKKVTVTVYIKDVVTAE